MLPTGSVHDPPTVHALPMSDDVHEVPLTRVQTPPEQTNCAEVHATDQPPQPPPQPPHPLDQPPLFVVHKVIESYCIFPLLYVTIIFLTSLFVGVSSITTVHVEPVIDVVGYVQLSPAHVIS